MAMIHARHPIVARTIVDELERGTACPSLAAARDAGRNLDGVEGCEIPSWTALLHGVRPPLVILRSRILAACSEDGSTRRLRGSSADIVSIFWDV